MYIEGELWRGFGEREGSEGVKEKEEQKKAKGQGEEKGERTSFSGCLHRAGD